MVAALQSHAKRPDTPLALWFVPCAMCAAWYNDTLKFNKKFKLRVAGHTKVSGVPGCDPLGDRNDGYDSLHTQGVIGRRVAYGAKGAAWYSS
jgi:hypothetical protein